MDADVVSGLLQSVRKEDPRRRRLESLESGGSKRPATRGCGGGGPAAALPLSDGSTASPASHRLASDPAALASRPPSRPRSKTTGERQRGRNARAHADPPAVGNAGFAGVYPPHTLLQQPARRARAPERGGAPGPRRAPSRAFLTRKSRRTSRRRRAVSAPE